MRPSQYDVLFEPVKIGPVTTRNRFYQVPHCNGMGRKHPTALAVMRATKAEGGWGVVCTEQCEIHPTAERNTEIRLWDEKDIPSLSRISDLVHEHGSLAGIQTAFTGHWSPNAYSREVSLGVTCRPVQADVPGFASCFPGHSKRMDKEDIVNLRRWHRKAAVNAKAAGFDIVYVYAAHDEGLPLHFLSRVFNQRTDEYGGTLENRARLFRELIEDTKEAVGDTCAVAVRLAVDQLRGPHGLTSDGEGRDVVEMLAELPDLWDVDCSGWENDSITSRFSEEGFQEDFVSFVKGVTTKPVVGVGRYTSPDRMVSLVKQGTFDLIGAARPSIADPFLPRKIEEGRIDDIRECIGCNICAATSVHDVPLWCTQNPTMGEEWRKGWHPELIPAKTTDDSVLVVGAGPAGLEAARGLGQRDYDVTLAEARHEIGGRVTLESELPGLRQWSRVRDYRDYQIAKMPNVSVYRESPLSADDVLQFGASVVAIATGSRWNRDGTGREHYEPIPGNDGENVLSPDDIMKGRMPTGKVLIYDDDHYYMASVIAELLAEKDVALVLATPAPEVASWTHNTLEQERIQKRLIELGVEIVPQMRLAAIREDTVELNCRFTGKAMTSQCDSVVLVTARHPVDDLYRELTANPERLKRAGIRNVSRIGDCHAPGTIASAVYQGHQFARNIDRQLDVDAVPFRREIVELTDLGAL